MSLLNRYQVKTYADTYFVLDDRFKKYINVTPYEEAVYYAATLNEAPEAIPVDPSIHNSRWKDTPKEAMA